MKHTEYITPSGARVGERLLKTLIELYAEQNGVTITYELEARQ